MPNDREMLEAGFEQLSPDSRYRRFLTAQRHLTPRTLSYLTDVDHHDHEALVAIDLETGKGVGVARFIRDPRDQRSAEVAIAVADEWQGQRVGTALADVLTDRARAEGIERFTALVLSENRRVLDLFKDLGEPETVARGGGTTQLVLPLPREGVGEHLAHALRASAEGRLTIKPPHPPRGG